MQVVLRKEKILNKDTLPAIALVAIVFLVAVLLLYYRLWLPALLPAWILLLTLFVWRKYAREISVDLELNEIRSIGIVPCFRRRFSFSELAYIRCLPARGLDGKEQLNLVFRHKRYFQPVIFEARSTQERRQVEGLLEKLSGEDVTGSANSTN